MQDQPDSLCLGSESCSTSDSEISEEDFDFLRTETWNNGLDMEDAEESDSSGGTDSETEQREESDSSGGPDFETEQRPTPIVVHPTLPKQLESVCADLLGDYTVPPFPPTDARPPPKIQDLSLSEKASLEHYVAWKKSNWTVKVVFSSPVKSSFFASKRGNWQPQPDP